MSRRPVELLVNPASGGKPGSGPPLDDDPARLTADALTAALRARGLEVETRVLSESDDPAALAAVAAAAGRDVVAAGGDGTVSAAARGLLADDEAALGILALGSFNNMARGFGIPMTLDAALDAIAAGETTTVDCGWVVRDDPDGLPFFEAAGVGLDALGFLAVEVAERHGWRRALRALWRGLRMRRTPMRISIDDRAYRTGSPAVTVSNGPYHGLGFAVSADADPTDGLLDVAVFGGMSRLDVIRHFFAVVLPRLTERVTPLASASPIAPAPSRFAAPCASFARSRPSL